MIAALTRALGSCVALATSLELKPLASQIDFSTECRALARAAAFALGLRRFDGRLSAAIGSYNAGPRAVSGWLRGDRGRLEDDVWVEEIPYSQTQAYVKRVLRSFHIYRSFY